jgi:hypothetical protein
MRHFTPHTIDPRAFDPSLHARFKHGMLWPSSTPPEQPAFVARHKVLTLVIITLLAACLSMLSIARAANLKDKLVDQAKATQKYSGLLAASLNGQTLFDNDTGNAFFFDKPVVVNVRK